MISDFIKNQKKQKMESTWFKQQQHLKDYTIKELIQHEKILQGNIIENKLLLENQLEVEKQLSQEKLLQLQLEKQKQQSIEYTNNMRLQKEYLENQIQKLQNQLEKNNCDDKSLIVNNIPTIYLVYQYSYKDNIKVTGFGDFIRACFYMLQFSDIYKINVDFNIYKHPIKQYLNYFSSKTDIDKDISNNITFFKDENCKYYKLNGKIYYKYNDIDNILLKFIKETKEYNQHKYLYLTNHPDETKISENHKEKIRELIKPTQFLSSKIEKCIHTLTLIKYKYIVIHVRTYDEDFYTNNTSIKNYHIDLIINYINTIKRNSNNTLFLISSCNTIKNIIINIIPDIKTIFHEITHIADSSITDDHNLINTLNDFYIMSFSKFIYSFSLYGHGSGFSKWCAVAYNIPYVCMSLT